MDTSCRSIGVVVEWILGAIAVCCVALLFEVDAVRVRLHAIQRVQEQTLAVLEESTGLCGFTAHLKREQARAELNRKADREYQELLKDVEREKLSRRSG